MHYKYARIDDFKDIPRPDFYAHSGNLILYGAGVNGLIASVLLKKMGVEFICFADSDERKWGTEYLGKPVISPCELKEKYPDVAIIITPYQFRPVYKQLNEFGYKIIFDCLWLFLEFETDDIEPLLPSNYLRGQFNISISNYIRKLFEFHVSGLGGYRSLTITVTEKCTLRCKYCLNFMPYYKSPRDYDFKKMKIALNRLLRTGKFAYINIEGGETFLYKYLDNLMNILISSTNVDYIYPITNATIIPSKNILEKFKNEKVIVRISNYGKNSYNLDELIDLFINEGINYNVMLQQWYRFDVKKYNRTEENNQNLFENCCKSDGSFFLVDGKLYRCGFAAHLEKLNIIPSCEEDLIDLTIEPYDEIAMKRKVNKFYKREKHINACNYCSGRGYMGIKVPIAEQINEKLSPLPKFK